MAETVLGGVLEFFGRLGIFDVVLPFLLTFTIVYALLQRTKLLGEDKKNLDAMSAVAVAFITVASSKVVAAILQVSSQLIVLLLLGVFFLLLVSSFYKQGELFDEKKGIPSWTKTTFVWLMLIAILAIFAQAVKTASGQSWLEFALQYLARYWDSAVVASIILIIGLYFFIKYLTEEQKAGGSH
jgi:lysylphosphatidylglycerol synthetase-like protein (DUF2156 family)